VGSVEGEEREKRHGLVKRKIGLDGRLDRLIENDGDQDDRNGDQRPREKRGSSSHRSASSDRRWRRASNSITAVATARLRLSARPCWGIRTSRFAALARLSGKPDCSLPISKATGFLE